MEIHWHWSPHSKGMPLDIGALLMLQFVEEDFWLHLFWKNTLCFWEWEQKNSEAGIQLL